MELDEEVRQTQDKQWNEFILRNLPMVVRSDGTTEPFQPDRILTSLLEETSIPEDEANRVTREIVLRFLNSKYKVVTAPFIREQVCSILFKLNQKWRFEYTRLGVPFHDFKQICTGFFDKFQDANELNEETFEQVILSLDRKTLAELVRRMAKDYVGVRNKIREVEDEESLPGGEPGNVVSSTTGTATRQERVGDGEKAGNSC